MTGTAFTVACVGAGYFAQLHHAAWQEIAGAALVGVADPDPIATSPKPVQRYDSLDAMLAAGPVDILDIVTPPASHAALIEAAIAAGVGRIICQKPFCGSLATARRMTDAAEEAGAALIVHENFRFQPWYRQLRGEIDRGRAGRLHQFRFALRPGDGQGQDAYLDRQPYFRKMDRFLIHETGVHFLDLFTYLFGLPASLYADLRRLNETISGEDAGIIICGYEDGMRAIFDGNRLADHVAENPRLTMGEAMLEGSQGSLRITGSGQLEWRQHGASDWQVLAGPPEDVSFGGGCVRAFCQHAVDAWQDGRSPETDARGYLRVLAMEEAAYASAMAGTRIDLAGI